MASKRREDKIRSVTYEYIGTDKQFDEFLKMLVHDYLAVDQPGTSTAAEIVDKVESSAA